jgi:site-specific DNA-methyltransferase (adenine-specific)
MAEGVNVDLRLGDCLEIMREMPAGSIDAVIIDPPYMINTKSDGRGKLSPWGDRVNAAFWYREWLELSRKKLLNRGCVWSFLNWRSIVTFQKAADDLGWPIESLLVWDKGWIGPGGMRGLRPSYELVALWAGDGFAIADRGLPDIKLSKWSSTKPNGHPAEKPVDLVQWLVEISTRPGDTVFDPFMGSGTTGEACVLAGRNFIGCEIDPTYYEMAKARIQKVQAQAKMF